MAHLIAQRKVDATGAFAPLEEHETVRMLEQVRTRDEHHFAQPPSEFPFSEFP